MMRLSPILCSTNRMSHSWLGVEERLDVGVQDEVHLPAFERDHERIECVVRPAAGPESVAEPEEVFLIDGIQHSSGRLWTILSSRAATASGRCRPSGLGMYTRRAGSAR